MLIFKVENADPLEISQVGFLTSRKRGKLILPTPLDCISISIDSGAGRHTFQFHHQLSTMV
jgi:hypothetical protein